MLLLAFSILSVFRLSPGKLMGASFTRPVNAGHDTETVRGSEPQVFAAAATGVVNFIERQKGDIDRIFGHAGISPEMAGSPTLRLNLSSYCQLFEECARLTHNGNFGLWFGNSFDPRDLGLIGYAALSAPTLGAALETLADLFPLHQQSSSLNLVKLPDGLARLEYRINAPQIIDRRQDAELSLGMRLNLIRKAIGPGWAPEEVHFEHPKPECWKEHQQAFTAPVYFSQPANAIVFRQEILKRQMPAADPRLMSAMRLCLEGLSEKKGARATVTDRVRTTVRARLPEGIPQIEDVATELRLSVGTIQRELNYDGLNYSTLVEHTRRDLSISYLAQRQLTFSEIAFIVGYSELSAFSRAVRRWTGQSPKSVRARLLKEHKS
jgi:AraC-like DNA-binding protein